MNKKIFNLKTTTLPVRKSINRSPLRRAFLLIPLVLAWVALSPTTQAKEKPDGDLGGFNTAEGTGALFSLDGGAYNTAMGSDALYSNTFGSFNTATGAAALNSNITGFNNTATGVDALSYNETGGGNTATGFQALAGNTGSGNTAIGAGAGRSLTTGDNNIDIGNNGMGGESNIIRIGTQGEQTNTYIAGIFAVSVPNGLGVVVDSTGHLGTVASSQRFKDAIKPMDKASEAILALKPVTFHYKKELDPEGISQFGLVAEEVEKVNPDLVARDADGKVYTVRYDAVNAMLLNEFLKEHRKVEQLEKQVETLTAGLERVKAQVGVSKALPQMVLKDR